MLSVAILSVMAPKNQGNVSVGQIFELVELFGAKLETIFLAGFACQGVSIRILMLG